MKARKFFLYSAGLFLLLTAIAKVFGSFGSARILSEPDPLLQLQYRTIFRVVGCFELFVGLTCVVSKRLWIPTVLVAWLSTGFAFYHVGLTTIHYQKPCPCMGNLTDALHISPAVADAILKMILAYLFLGSYSILLWCWKTGGNSTESSPSEKLATVG